MFDVHALYRALDSQRAERGLTWAGVAREMSADLDKSRSKVHPIAASTLANVAQRRDISCQHALGYLCWLGRDPEDFVEGAPASTRAPLPVVGPGQGLRWHLHASERRDLPGLYEALNDRRQHHQLTWPALARELHCGPSQLTGLRTARYATGIRLAMTITQWLDRPAADFVYPVNW